jgi:hypothetical protein
MRSDVFAFVESEKTGRLLLCMSLLLAHCSRVFDRERAVDERCDLLRCDALELEE